MNEDKKVFIIEFLCGMLFSALFIGLGCWAIGRVMIELRFNTKTQQKSWGFTDGVFFYPFGNSEIAKAMASFALMEFKANGATDGLSGEALLDWTIND